MSISVKYFASLAEELGRRDDAVVATEVSALEVWHLATGRATLPTNVLVAVNQQYVDPAAMVHDGDEIAFFPPVTGG